MTKGSGRVFRLSGDDAEEVVDVLCESFFNYPVMRFVLGSNAADYEEQLRTLIRFFVAARALRGEIMLGIGDEGDLSGAALLSRPTGQSPPELSDLREKVWAELGASARARYEALGAAGAPFQVEIPHIHVNMIGVRHRAQGEGLGGKLMEHVHLVSREDRRSMGITLTTEDQANVALYEHLGYEVVGHATVAPDLETWGFFRPD
jgi:ribosomal protein S18 acetylase RimI-like enzyme